MASPSTPRVLAWQCTLVALFAAGGEGAGAAWSAHAAGGHADAILWAGLGAAAVLAPPLLLLALAVAFLVTRSHTGTLVEGLTRAAGGHAGLALLAASALAGAAGAGADWLGRQSIGVMSVPFASAATVLAAIVLSIVGLALSAYVGALLAPRLRALEARWPWVRELTSPTFIALALATSAVGIVVGLLSLAYAAAPVGAAVGLALGRARRPIHALARAPAWPLALVLVPLSVLALVRLPKLPTEAQFSVLYRAPYASLGVGAIRNAFDRDRDGYSRVLGGGDCNDWDAAIHPGAPDIPGNNEDENCSGADAQPFEPQLEPSEPRPAGLPSRMNVVLVQVDALRPDHLGFAGYARPTSPNIDRFRAGAAWFQRAYSPAPSTRFATASLLTGFEVEAMPQERGPRIDFTLLPTATVASRLISYGYDRVGFTISYVAQHIHGLEQGFRVWKTPWPVGAWKETYVNAGELTTDAGIEYLSGVAPDGQSPFLLFMHYQCTHDPYIEHDEWRYGSRELDQYDSALNYCDREIGRFLDKLSSRPDYDRTAVLFFSDHGELFGEHGFTRHGNTLSEPDVRSVLLVRVPGNNPVRTVDDAVTLTDIAPTVLELASVPGRDPRILAWSLLRYLYPPGAKRPERHIFLYGDHTRGTVHFEARGVVEGQYKYVHDLGTGIEQLFRLDKDPGETENLAMIDPERRERLGELVDSWEAYVASRR